MSQEIKNKTWLGALASAIKALAATIINLLSVANEGISMAQQAVEVAREKQAVDLTIGKSDYATTAIQIAAVNQAKVQEDVHKFVEADSTGTRKKAVQETNDRLTKLVNEELARIKAARMVD